MSNTARTLLKAADTLAHAAADWGTVGARPPPPTLAARSRRSRSRPAGVAPRGGRRDGGIGARGGGLPPQ